MKTSFLVNRDKNLQSLDFSSMPSQVYAQNVSQTYDLFPLSNDNVVTLNFIIFPLPHCNWLLIDKMPSVSPWYRLVILAIHLTKACPCLKPFCGAH